MEGLDFHKYCGQTFVHQTNFLRQKSQKMLPCRHFGGHCSFSIGHYGKTS
jgi:hypothetical protein